MTRFVSRRMLFLVTVISCVDCNATHSENNTCFLLVSGNTLDSFSEVSRLVHMQKVSLNTFKQAVVSVGHFPSYRIRSFEFDPVKNRYYFLMPAKYNDALRFQMFTLNSLESPPKAKTMSSYAIAFDDDITSLRFDEKRHKLYFTDFSVVFKIANTDNPLGRIALRPDFEFEFDADVIGVVVDEASGVAFTAVPSETYSGFAIRQRTSGILTTKLFADVPIGSFCGMIIDPRPLDKRLRLMFCYRKDTLDQTDVYVYSKCATGDIPGNLVVHRSIPFKHNIEVFDFVSTQQFIYFAVGALIKVYPSQIWKIPRDNPDLTHKVDVTIEINQYSRMRLITSDPKNCESEEMICPAVSHEGQIKMAKNCHGTVGELCDYSCTRWRKVGGSKQIKCSHGFWEGELSTYCTDTCKTVSDIKLDEKCNRQPGRTCTYACNNGRETVSKLMCKNGFWSNSTGLCTNYCVRDIPNGHVDVNCRLKSGENCKYWCVKGYRQVFETITCKNGYWTNEPQTLCTDVCDRYIPNGEFNVTCTRRYLETCAFTCNANARQAVKTLRCVDGYWDRDTESVCQVVFWTDETVAPIAVTPILIVLCLIIFFIILYAQNWLRKKNQNQLVVTRSQRFRREEKKEMKRQEKKRKHVVWEHKNLRKRIDKALKHEDKEVIESLLTEYETLCAANGELIDLDEKILTAARRKISILEEQEFLNSLKSHFNFLKDKVEGARAHNDVANTEKALREYQVFYGKHADYLVLDQSIVEKTCQHIAELHEKERREALKAECLRLEQNVHEAVESGDKEQIEKFLEEYKSFCAENRPYVEENDSVVHGATDKLSLIRRQVLQKQSKELEDRIVSAVELGDMQAIQNAVNAYKSFCSDYKFDVTVDRKVLRKASMTVSLIKQSEERQRLEAEFSELKIKLVSSMNAFRKDEIKSALSAYQSFCEKNCELFQIDGELVKQSYDVLLKIDEKERLNKLQEQADGLRQSLDQANKAFDEDLINQAFSDYLNFFKADGAELIPDEEIVKETNRNLIFIQEKKDREKLEELSKILKAATVAGKKGEMEKALSEYQAFCNAHGDVPCNTALIANTENKLAAIYKQEAVMALRSKLSGLESRLMELNKGFEERDIVEALDEYVKFCNEHNCDISVNESLVKETNVILAKIEEKKTREMVVAQFNALKEKLASACASRDKDTISSIIDKYRELQSCHPDFLEFDSSFVTGAEKVISEIKELERRAPIEAHYMAIKSKLTSAIHEKDKELISKILAEYKQFCSLNDDVVRADDGLVHEAQETVATITETEIKKRLEAKLDVLKAEICDALASMDKERIEQATAAYEHLCESNVKYLTPDDTLVVNAKETVCVIQENMKIAALQSKFSFLANCLAAAAKSTSKSDIESALQEYQFFYKDHSHCLDYDNILEAQALDAIAAIEKKERFDVLKQRLWGLKANLEKANLNSDKEHIEKALQSYLQFFEENEVKNMDIDIDESLVHECRSTLHHIKKREERELLQKKLDALKDALSNSIQSTDQQQIMNDMNQYEALYNQHKAQVSLDFDKTIFDQAAHVLQALRKYEEWKHLHEEHDQLRDALVKANDTLEVDLIDPAMNDYVNFYESHMDILKIDEKLVQEARCIIYAAKKREELAKASKDDDLEGLEKVIREIEEMGLERFLEPLFTWAKAQRDRLRRVLMLNKAVLSIDRALMNEIRGYSQPPKQVHEIMIASLLLLGDNEGLTRKWIQCQKLFSTIPLSDYVGLYYRIKNFKLSQLHPEIAARCLEILEPYSQDEVSKVCLAAGEFYTWARSLSEECLDTCKESLVVPAKLKRQKTIVKEMQKGNYPQVKELFNLKDCLKLGSELPFQGKSMSK